MTQCFTAQSMATDALSVHWASDLHPLSRVDLDYLWKFSLPTEYVPGTSRPTVDVVPALYVLTSDSAMALITGQGRTLKKYTIEKDLAARKAALILEIRQQLLWGKDLQTLVTVNLVMVKDLLSTYKNSGSSIRVISLVLWSGKGLNRWTCGVREILKETSMSFRPESKAIWSDGTRSCWGLELTRPLSWRARSTRVWPRHGFHYFC